MYAAEKASSLPHGANGIAQRHNVKPEADEPKVEMTTAETQVFNFTGNVSPLNSWTSFHISCMYIHDPIDYHLVKLARVNAGGLAKTNQGLADV